MYMFFGIILLCIVYYYVNSQNKEKKVEIVEEENNDFIPSDTFIGAKEGYVFKNGDLGIGYYIDNNI
jgi:hypothetical protein